MSEVELHRLDWAGKNLRRIGPVLVELSDILAEAQTERYAVLYLKSGEKLLVAESLEEISRLAQFGEVQREVRKRFKREIRELKRTGMAVDHAFAALWEEVSCDARLPESELSALYEELLDWTKRWLK